MTKNSRPRSPSRISTLPSRRSSSSAIRAMLLQLLLRAVLEQRRALDQLDLRVRARAPWRDSITGGEAGASRAKSAGTRLGLDGAGAASPARPRAAARSSAAARRRRRRRRARGAGRRAREALDQEGLEARRARPGDPDDGSDDARRSGHARQGVGPVREGDASRSRRPVDPVRRRRLRLPEPRRRGEGEARGLDA